ncbi:DUF2513 domain-containing protein [Aerococcaceae bacterium DSM 111020]|nr:DUF2513 domain-containing protein [Aerococcaceae bacterium DSM 111020]
MRLNYDCIRDILLDLEKELKPNDFMTHDRIKQLRSYDKYSFDDYQYSLIKLEEAGYIEALFSKVMMNYIHSLLRISLM